MLDAEDRGGAGGRGPGGSGLQLLSGAPADLPRWQEALPRAEKAATAAAAGRLEVPALGFGSLHLRRAQKSPRALGRHTGLVHVPGRWQPRGQACAQPRQSTVSLAHGVAGQGSEAPAQGSAAGQDRARAGRSPRGLGVAPPAEGDTPVAASSVPVSARGRGLLQPEGRGPRSATRLLWPGPHPLSAGLSPVWGAGAEGGRWPHPRERRGLKPAPAAARMPARSSAAPELAGVRHGAPPGPQMPAPSEAKGCPVCGLTVHCCPLGREEGPTDPRRAFQPSGRLHLGLAGHRAESYRNPRMSTGCPRVSGLGRSLGAAQVGGNPADL